jgi:hypothetical protein
VGRFNPDELIRELNARFRQHGVGYQYEGGRITRVDSQYVHAKVVKPALQLLNAAGNEFGVALGEFRSAHERYRKGELQDAIVWACKAFESTMKAICTIRAWAFDPNRATVTQLTEVLFANGLVPAYLQSQFTSLKSVMDSGVGTVRNKAGGHGAGVNPVNVPGHLAAYVLHLTAANIVFLVEAHKALNRPAGPLICRPGA